MSGTNSTVHAAFCGAADIYSLRHDRGLQPSAIDWERLLTISYRHYVQRGGVVIDVGAHNGMHSRRFQRYLRPATMVLFEPIPALAAGLAREFRRADNTEVREVALSNRSGTDTFVLHGASPGESGLRDRYGNDDQKLHRPQTTSIEVALDRLDNQKIPPGISFIKIDVEGGELDVLRGAQRRIRLDRPIISIEFGHRAAAVYGYGTAELLEFADVHGLAIVDLFGNELGADEFVEVAGTYYWDYLLIPQERMAEMATARSAVRGEAFRTIDTFNPTIERWKKRLRY